MNSRLIVSYYRDKSSLLRQGEIDYCLQMNLKAGFDEVLFFTESDADFEYLSSYLDVIKSSPGIISASLLPSYSICQFDKKPQYKDFLSRCNKGFMNVMSNSDIYFDRKSIAFMKAYFEAYEGGVDNLALALTRYDIKSDGSVVLFDRPDSQDVWVVFGESKGLPSIDFGMGEAGCDNRIAYELEQMGYDVKNPSRTIRTYHCHSSSVRHYLNEAGVAKEVVPPPYKLINPE